MSQKPTATTPPLATEAGNAGATSPERSTAATEPADNLARGPAARISAATSGLIACAVTPFNEDSSIDLDSLKTQLAFFKACGASGVHVLGEAGEASRLTDDERLQIVRAAVRAGDGQLPVIATVDPGGIDNLVLFSRRVMDLGAAGINVAPDRSLHTDEAVYGYFEAVAGRLGDIPWILQDNPRLTGVTLATWLVVRMIKDFDNLAVLWHEDRPGLTRITELRDAQRQGGRPVAILTGNSGIHYPLELGRGADGVITASAFPELFVQTRERYAAGKRDDAEDIFDAWLPIIRHERQPGLGLAVRKYLLARRKAIRTDRTRAPGPHLEVLDRQEADHLVRRAERRTRQLGIGQAVAFAP